MNQFDELVEEGHVAHDALLKIFTKKIKRSKKKDEGASLQSMVDGSVCNVQCGHGVHDKCCSQAFESSLRQTQSGLLAQSVQ